MGSSKTKVFSEIDLGEFERRLLAAHSLPRGAEDPLSELTRLVSTIAADRAAGAKIVELTSRSPKPEWPAPEPESSPEPVAAAKPEPVFTPKPEPAVISKREPVFEPKPKSDPPSAPKPAILDAPAVSPRLEKLRARFAGFGTTTDREAEPVEMRREPAPPATASPPPQAAVSPSLHSALLLDHDEALGDFVAPPPVVKAARADHGRQGSWYLKVGGLTALGVLMAAGAIAMKLGVTGTHKPPPLILAAESPSKVAPPSEAAVQSPGDSGSLLLKDSAAPTPAKIVNNEEVPVDLSAITKESQPASPPPAPAPAPQPSASATASVAEATPVAPTADTPIVAPSENLSGAPPSAPAAFPAAKRVKTVSVRPDGTLISVDSAPATPPSQSAAPAPAAPAPVTVASTTAPLAATPTLDLPEKAAAKSSARVTASKTATTVPPDDEFNPPKPDAAAAPEKAAKLPTKLRPPKAAANATAVIASNATPAAESVGGGGWAVQLAAPRSEAEAQSDVSRLKTKYADNLGGAAIAVHKAEVNGETIYRVRAGGLTKADAAALCAKLKASGGDCFVARN
jgi:hypothetical protein